MISLLLLQATLGAIGRQALAPGQCAAFLWSRGEQPQLVAMASAGPAGTPAPLRVSLDGKPIDLPRTAAEGASVRGVAAASHYAAGDVTATLELVATERPDLTDGALVQEATLTVSRTGHDTIVAPLGGLIGCGPATPPQPERRRR